MKKAVLVLVIAVAAAVGLYLFYPEEKPVQKEVLQGENVICFGDSLTAGTGASPGMDYPSQLSGLVADPVINAGVPGDTTQDAAARLEKDVLERSPRIVLITLGGNDLKNGVPSREAFTRLKDIVERIQERGALVVVGGIDIPFRGRSYYEGYKTLCEETGALLIPNIYEGILGRDDLMSDPIHPNDRGYQIIAERFYAVIKGYQKE
ncbi:MAG TPA: arylesterase [Deltaproteobacteria bacterium]|jgi:lysophospholipase L1-like esterase|nr:arylesterase [Deltaproteobacteria bacterium]HOI06714.1 arylesterase [Deltaproteobacteria bacterium]